MPSLYYSWSIATSLLELEYKYGTNTRFRPAIEDVMNYLETVISVLIIYFIDS